LTYQERFFMAVEKTLKLGLILKDYPLGFCEACSEDMRTSILLLSAEALCAKGFKSSSLLANKCVLVHLTVQYFLKEVLNIDSYITIGDRYWTEDDIYCEMSYQYIKSELKAPNIDKTLDAHIWLTLPDGSILDCSAEAYLDVRDKRGEYPVDNCLMFVRPSETPISGYHRPYLVGADFLEKVGVFKEY
jgi:hypothetical protein